MVKPTVLAALFLAAVAGPALGYQIGEAIHPTSDADICPTASGLLAVEAERAIDPDQAASMAAASHCLLAMSDETVKVLGGKSLIYHFIGPGDQGTITVRATDGGQDIVGFALPTSFK